MNTAHLIGQNRSGIARAPKLGEQMLEAIAEFPPSSEGGPQGLARQRIDYAKSAEPMASMPPPIGLGKLAKNAVSSLAGGQPNLYLDKLGERLAFERSGTRLYEALLSKVEALGSFAGGPQRDELIEIYNDELEHFGLLSAVIERLGGDPTAVTPSANVHAVASKGLVAVLTDPRTDVQQCLEAILIAELADNDCWTSLVELAELNGDQESAADFERCLDEESEHLRKVRLWLAAGQHRSLERARENDQAQARALEKAHEQSHQARASGEEVDVAFEAAFDPQAPAPRRRSVAKSKPSTAHARAGSRKATARGRAKTSARKTGSSR